MLVAEPAVVFHHHVACLLPVEVDWIERKVVSGMYQHTAYELAAPPAKPLVWPAGTLMLYEKGEKSPGTTMSFVCVA